MNAAILITALAIGAPAPRDAKPHPLVGTWLVLTFSHDGKTTNVERRSLLDIHGRWTKRGS